MALFPSFTTEQEDWQDATYHPLSSPVFRQHHSLLVESLSIRQIFHVSWGFIFGYLQAHESDTATDQILANKPLLV